MSSIKPRRVLCASVVKGFSRSSLARDFRRRSILLFLQAFRLRLVDAERFLIEIVAGSGKGAGAASHADVAELATSAFSFQVVGVAQFVEHYRVLPDVGERLLFQPPSQGGQVPAGTPLALRRKETHGGSGQTPFGHGVHVGGMRAGV